MAMNDARNASISASAPNNQNARRARRRRSSRRSFKNFGSMLSGSASSRLESLEDGSSNHSSGNLDASSRSFSDRLSLSMPGFRSRLSDPAMLPFELDATGNTSTTTDKETSRSPKKRSSRSRMVPSLRRAMSLQTSTDDKVLLKKEKQAAEEKTRITPGRSKSGSILKRAAQAARPNRPTRRASPPPLRPEPTRTSDLPELRDMPKGSLRGSLHNDIPKESNSRGRNNKDIPKNSMRGNKSVTISPDVSISPPRRERSKSPFRRTRSTPEVSPSIIRNAKGEVIDLNDYEDLSESTASLSPRRSTSPMRRSVSGGAIVANSMASRKAKGTITKADLAPRIPLNRGRSSTLASARDLTPRMPALNRGRSLGSAAVALRRMGSNAGASPSPSHSDQSRDKSPLRRVPPKRPSGRLARAGSFRNSSKTSLLPRSGSSTAALNQSAALVGRGVRATKSACSDLAAMQMALGRTAAKTTVRGVAGGGAAIMGGLRATKSACGLGDMQKALGGGGGGAPSRRTEIQPDPIFQEMMQWNPLDADDRAKYDDVSIKRLIRRNPDALKAKYDVQVGRSTITKSPLSTVVALGASLETVRAAIKAHPAGLKASDMFRSTPLHTACSFNTDMMVVRYIYHKYPDAIKATTKHVFLPLHNACQMATPSLELIQFLVEAYPEGLTEINKLGDTPLRTAERNDSTPQDVLEYLEEETERIFSQNAESELKRKEIMMRQSWGSKELDALQIQLDDTDHTTISTALMDQSEHSTSEEFSSEFGNQNSMPDLSQENRPMVSLLDK